MASIKIGVMPGRMADYEIPQDGITVANALNLASLSHAGYDVRLNDSTIADMNTLAGNGDIIMLIKAVKGNYGETTSYLMCDITIVSNNTKESASVGVESGTRVGAVIGMAFPNLDSEEVKEIEVNGRKGNMYDTIYSKSKIVLHFEEKEEECVDGNTNNSVYHEDEESITVNTGEVYIRIRKE